MNSYDCSQSRPEDEHYSYIPPQIGLNYGPSMTPPPLSLQDYRDEVESTSHNNAIETHCGVITPENLIWDPPNLKELGPMKLVGVYNLPPAFWPASLKDRVKNLGINVDGIHRADDSSNIKNPSSFVSHDTTEDLLENLNCSTPSLHANEDFFKILGLTAAITEQSDKKQLPLRPDVMEAAATDSEELLPYFTGLLKRKRAISSGNEFSPAAESFEMIDDFEPPCKASTCESVEDLLSTPYHAFHSNESTAFYDAFYD